MVEASLRWEEHRILLIIMKAAKIMKDNDFNNLLSGGMMPAPLLTTGSSGRWQEHGIFLMMIMMKMIITINIISLENLCARSASGRTSPMRWVTANQGGWSAFGNITNILISIFG